MHHGGPPADIEGEARLPAGPGRGPGARRRHLPPEHPESYNQNGQALAAENPAAYFPDQHNNRENTEAHYRTTGPEIWRQMDGRHRLPRGRHRHRRHHLRRGSLSQGAGPIDQVIAVDPEGSVFYDHFHRGCWSSPGSYLLEGLGDEEIIGCPEFELIDDMFRVTDRDAFLATRELARTEGILAGGSSGAALWAVRKLAAGSTDPPGSSPSSPIRASAT